MAEGDKIRVMIVDDITDTREQLEKLLYFEKDIEVVAKAGSGTEAIRLAKQHNPDIVLMDINMPDMDGIAATEAILAQVPDAEVIMMSVQGEQDYLRRSMLAGARQFLIKPISADELYASIRQVYGRKQARPRPAVQQGGMGPAASGEPVSLGQILAIFSPKGGVGTTSIAANLAVAIRQLSNKKVVLVDGNLSFGDIGAVLNLVSQKTIADLAQRIDALDRELLNDVLTTHPAQIKVLLAPPNPQIGELVTPDHLRAILELLRREFDYVVVDTESSFHERALSVLDLADRIVVLTTLELTCIKNIKHFLEIASMLEYPAEKMLLVLNKADSRLGIKVESVEESLQQKVALQIGNAAQDVTLSINQGVPLVIDKRSHPTARDIFALAQLLTAARQAPKEAPAAAPRKEDDEKGGLFGRLMPRPKR